MINIDHNFLPHRLLRLAEIVRAEAEAMVRGGNHGPCADVNLGGGCGEVSWVFVELAREAGFYLVWYGGLYNSKPGQVPASWLDRCGHCWAQLGGQIWDLTATQFDSDLPGVHISDEISPHYENGQPARTAMPSWVGYSEWSHEWSHELAARSRKRAYEAGVFK